MSSRTITETQLKCSSLPPGFSGPVDMTKLNRSSSTACSKSQDHFNTLDEEDDKEEKTDKSFFERLFPRRSAKKKRHKQEEKEKATVYSSNITSTTQSISKSSVTTTKITEKRPVALPRTGAASRQRIQPIDIPVSPGLTRKYENENVIMPKPSPEKSLGTSPLQLELENRFRQKMMSSSPPAAFEPLVEHIPESPPPKMYHTRFSKFSETKSGVNTSETKSEDFRSKVKIAGFTPLQQRVLSHADEIDDGGFKSLTDLPTDTPKITRPVTKSHSFKTVKPSVDHMESNRYTFTSSVSSKQVFNKQEEKLTETKTENRQSIIKAASLDSIKNLDATFYHDKKENTVTERKEEKSMSIEETNIKQTETNQINSEIPIPRERVSIAKVQLKRELPQVVESISIPKPEFMNRQLNKVEHRASSNVIFKTNSPRIIDEQSQPKTVFSFDSDKDHRNAARKFSKDDVEIIDKDVNEEIVEVPKTSLVTITSMTPHSTRIYKKNTENVSPRRSSIFNEKDKLMNKNNKNGVEIVNSIKKSASADSLIRSSQESLDKLDDVKSGEQSPASDSQETASTTVVLRRKSLVKQQTDDEPELMKVFARRSLKLKDSETEDLSQQVQAMVEESSLNNSTKSRDSDKENQSDSPVEERKKSIIVKEFPKIKETSEVEKSIKETQNTQKLKESPIAETKFVETAEVTLRKPLNNKFFYQRTTSLNQPNVDTKKDLKINKQASFNERPRTDNWFLGNKKEDDQDQDCKIASERLIKTELIYEDLTSKPKNFNQRKAEWEKRAQEALKKTVP